MGAGGGTGGHNNWHVARIEWRGSRVCVYAHAIHPYSCIQERMLYRGDKNIYYTTIEIVYTLCYYGIMDLLTITLIAVAVLAIWILILLDGKDTYE